MNIDELSESQAQFTQQLSDLLKAKIIRENPKPGPMQRDAHPKQHGLVRARFQVERELAPELAHGVFQPGQGYDCWIRFSNQNAPALSDWDKDIRGMALKLINVPGPKLLPGMEDAQTQDFILISTPKFVTENLEQFLGLIRALTSGKMRLGLFLLTHPSTAKNLFDSNRRFADPSRTRYWSTTPYYLGDKIVKYSAIPHRPNDTEPSESDGPDFMRNNLREHLQARSACFDFCVQFHKPGLSLENVGREWPESESPFIKVATIEIPTQEFDTKAQNLYGRQLSFNPWHSLAAHRPTGEINLARRVIYQTISEFRHQENGVNYREPNDMKVPPLDDSGS